MTSRWAGRSRAVGTQRSRHLTRGCSVEFSPTDRTGLDRVLDHYRRRLTGFDPTRRGCAVINFTYIVLGVKGPKS